MNNRFFLFLVMPLFIVSCGTSEDNEYFCESTHFGSNNSSPLYFQSSVKINKDGMCLYHRGSEFCTTHGKIIDGFIDKSGWDKYLIHSEKYLSSVDGENYLFNVYKKYALRKDANVETTQVGDDLHFSFEGKKLKPTLALKLANEESILIYKIAAIENVKYSYASGDFVTHKTEKTISNNKDNRFKGSIWEKEEVIFDYGSQKYNEIKSYINGTYLYNVNTFNKTNLSLVSKYTHPHSGSEGIYRYTCQIWKKQKWYEFP